MKEVKAYIKPHKLDEVMFGLSVVQGLTGMSFSRVEGYGRGRGTDGATPLTGTRYKVPLVRAAVRRPLEQAWGRS